MGYCDRSEYSLDVIFFGQNFTGLGAKSLDFRFLDDFAVL